MRQQYMIDGYKCWLPMATTNAACWSSHWCEVMSGSSTTLPNSANDLCRDTRATSAVLDGWSDVVGMWEWDKEELWSESRERRKLSVGCFFLLFLLFSSLLHSLLLHWISARYKWRRHEFYHLRILFNGMWSFPASQIHWKATARCQSVVGLLSLYQYVRGMIV